MLRAEGLGLARLRSLRKSGIWLQQAVANARAGFRLLALDDIDSAAIYEDPSAIGQLDTGSALRVAEQERQPH